jgi:6-pyruvoyltetrahydropterin/6-carboxytetrahydropterin synthase
MFELKVVNHFAAAHQLAMVAKKCENLHGHNWKIEVFVKGDKLGEDGLLIDFKLVKRATEQVTERLDHTFLNDLDYFKEINPSSENIAKYIFNEISQNLNNPDISVSRITVWESDSACATYWESE